MKSLISCQYLEFLSFVSVALWLVRI